MKTQNWTADALCARVDNELWFPEVGSTPKPAKAICQGCSVRVACLQWALDHNEPSGVWGGYTAQERRGMVAAA